MYDILKKLNAIETTASTPAKSQIQESATVVSERAMNKYAIGMATAKKQAGITKTPARDLPKKVIKKGHEIAKAISEEEMQEGFADLDKYMKDKEKAKGTGKYDKTTTDKGTRYTKKYDADTDVENSDEEDTDKDTKSKGGRKVGSKSGARHSYKKIDEAIAQAYGDFFEGDLEEDDMEEGNRFINNLRKARAAGEKEADLDGDGDMEPVKPGKTFEEETIEERWSAPINPTDFYLVDVSGNPISQSPNEKDMRSLEQQYLKSGWDVEVVRGDELSKSFDMSEAKSCNHTMEGESCPMHGESKCPMSESADNELDEVRALAGLQECGPAMSGDTSADTMSINTNIDSNGHKSVNISAEGNTAVALMQMLKLAGMGSSHISQDDHTNADTYSVASEEEMEEEHVPGHLVGNGTEPRVMSVQTLTKGGDGEVAGKEKQMHPHGYKFSDNPLSMENKLGGRFLKEYESIKLARGK